MSQPTVVIILPTLNEEETIGKIIDEIPQDILREKGYQVKVLVVDGSSADLTRQIAQERGTEVIVESGRGKGRAMRRAFERVEADFVFMLDADYTYPAAYIPDMLDILHQGCDVVIGSRLKGNIIPRLRLSATGFNFEAELFSQIVKSGYSIGEVPIYYRRCPTPTKLSSIKDGLTIGWTLLSRRLK